MQIPEEVLDKGLTPREFYLLAVLCRNVDRWGDVDLTMEQLGELTGSSRTTLWRDMTALESHGLVDVSRTKRNYGKLHKNKYKLLCFELETSTAVSNDLDEQVTNKDKLTITTKVKNTSYSLYGSAVEGKKETMNKWSDDDDIGGFGLLEGELPSAKKLPAVSKKDAKTRHTRPQHEWTPNDVASEFASQLYSKIRGIPGLLNINKLAPILGKNRKVHGTTALMELEVITLMMNDNQVLYRIKQDPANAWRVFLRMITTHGQRALENLGLDDATLDIEVRDKYVYAKDGTKFDNSMPGRRELQQYEESLEK